MGGIQLHDLLVMGKGMAPVLFLLLYLRVEKIGLRVFRIDLEHIAKRHSGFWEVPRLHVFLRFQPVFCLTLLRATASRRENQQGNESDTENR